MSSSDCLVYAGFWVRFIAYVIDSIVVIAPITAVGLAHNLVFARVPDDDTLLVVTSLLLAAFTLVGWWLYEALMTSSMKGATLGKRAMGLRIVTADGTRLTIARATARMFLRIMNSAFVPFGIGFLLISLNMRKRALHDFMADTLVIKSC